MEILDGDKPKAKKAKRPLSPSSTEQWHSGAAALKLYINHLPSPSSPRPSCVWVSRFTAHTSCEQLGGSRTRLGVRKFDAGDIVSFFFH